MSVSPFYFFQKIMYNFVDQRINSNRNLNLFYKKDILDQFSADFFHNIMNIEDDQLDALMNYTIDKVLSELYRVNQYYNFDETAKEELKGIYLDFHKQIKLSPADNTELLKNHRSKLGLWLKKTNPFAEKIYTDQEEKVDSVACFEYSADLQSEILQLDLTTVMEPILDIGCGENATLVEYLRSNGKTAYGIDRYPSEKSYIEIADWLEYDYDKNTWGTIISNMAFSNHFIHHHLREDGNYIAYAQKYTEILNSLKSGGSFHYAPDLSFIENFLDKNKYEISRKEVREGYKSVVIKRRI